MSKITIVEGNSNDKDPTRAYMVKGEKGDTGDIGPANSLSIGTVVKGDTAGATITGDAPEQTLNLVLPKGDKGDKGEKGDNTIYEIPAGSIIGFDGNTVPTGYEEVDDKRFQIYDTNNTDFEIIIPHNGSNNIKHAFAMTVQWCGVISVGNSTQTWVKKMANTDSVECTATQLENTATYVKVQLTFTSTQYGLEVICPYIN